MSVFLFLCPLPASRAVPNMVVGVLQDNMDDVQQFLSRQEELCLTAVKEYPGDDIVKDSLSSLKSAQKAFSEAKSTEGSDDTQMCECVRKYTKSVLDLTFKWEQVIVEEDFAKPGTSDVIQKVVDSLALPMTVCCLATGGDKTKMSSYLDKEMEECLYWRVGALLYMYCYTVLNGGEELRTPELKDAFRKYCMAGVAYLELMLSTRTPLTKEEFESSDKGQVAQLLLEGVFSDTHMLALMYCGDMCYWCLDLEQPLDNNVSTSRTNDDVLKGGTECPTKCPTRGDKPTSCTESDKSTSCKEENHLTSRTGETSAKCTEGHKSTSCTKDDTSTICTGETAKCTEGDESTSCTKDDTSTICTGETSSCTEGDKSTNCTEDDTTSHTEVNVSQTPKVGDVSAVCTRGDVTPTHQRDPNSDKPTDPESDNQCEDTMLIQPYNLMVGSKGVVYKEEWCKAFDPVCFCERYLSRYISVARGPLRELNWKYDRAVELLVQLKKRHKMSLKN